MTWLDRFADPRFVVSIAILGIFGWAFGENVSDDTMKGAIIGALNVVAGFWLGSSRGAADSAARTDKALDIAHEATRAMPSSDKADVMLRPGETARAEGLAQPDQGS